MQNNEIITRRSWLPLALIQQRNKISDLLLRLRGIGVRAGTSLKLHTKFMRMMDQVAIDRDKELSLLDEIEKIEKRHELMRQQNRLRRADCDDSPKPTRHIEPEQAPERSDKTGAWGWLAILAFMHLNHKKQDLTVD